MDMVVATDLNWGIGYRGSLLEYIPEDLKMFKTLTENNIIVMGRKTFESLPNKQPLPNRTNIVISSNSNFTDNKNIIIFDSVDKVLQEIYYTPREKKVYIIGGESIYKEFLPYCTDIYVTKILNRYQSDRLFPNLDILSGYKLLFASETFEYKKIKFNFLKYTNLNKSKIL